MAGGARGRDEERRGETGARVCAAKSARRGSSSRGAQSRLFSTQATQASPVGACICLGTSAGREPSYRAHLQMSVCPFVRVRGRRSGALVNLTGDSKTLDASLPSVEEFLASLKKVRRAREGGREGSLQREGGTGKAHPACRGQAAVRSSRQPPCRLWARTEDWPPATRCALTALCWRGAQPASACVLSRL